MSNDNAPRHPAGQPVGGQFAEKARSPSKITLEDESAVVETPGELVDTVRDATGKYERGELTDGAYYLDAVNERFGGHVDANLYEDDFFYPMVRSIERGDDAEAEHQAQRALRFADRERRWREDTTFTEPEFTVVEDDVGYGARVHGAKYQPGQPLRDVGKGLRADIAEAARAGYLPDDMEYRVHTSNRGGGTIQVNATGMPDEDRYVLTDRFGGQDLVDSNQARLYDDRLTSLAAAYTQQQSNTAVDYWNHSAYVQTNIDGESHTRRAAASRDKQTAAQRIRDAARADDDAALDKAVADNMAAEEAYETADRHYDDIVGMLQEREL